VDNLTAITWASGKLDPLREDDSKEYLWRRTTPVGRSQQDSVSSIGCRSQQEERDVVGGGQNHSSGSGSGGAGLGGVIATDQYSCQ
jgi:hypothetical protein